MLNQRSIQTVDASHFSKYFVKPLYDSYCFSNIPGTIKQLLGVDNNQSLPKDTLTKPRVKKVVFLFIDSFGWEFWEKHSQNYPFLKRFLTDGVVSKLTSQFPSTTSAHVTTIHTGTPVGQSGIYEWYYYEPKVDAIIAPLLYSFAGDKQRDTLKAAEIKPQDIFPTKSFYKDLRMAGIQSYVVQFQDYTPSTYSDVVFEGATSVIPYRDLAHGLITLGSAVKKTQSPSYFFFYYSNIDSSGHVEGPNSSVHQAEIHVLFTALENLFYEQIKTEKDLTILLSADHGMAPVSPQDTYYLDKESPEITKYLKKSRKNRLLVPAGSCRDMFLHVDDEQLTSVKSLLEKKLRDRAEIYLTQTLLDQGFFGTKVSQELLGRLGNLTILPYKREAVWWYENGLFEQKFYGHHGGLTAEEMEIPFLCF